MPSYGSNQGYADQNTPWQMIKNLRTSGQHRAAIEAGLAALNENPSDFRVRTQTGWAYYGAIKEEVMAVSQSQGSNQDALAALDRDLIDFSNVVSAPEMCVSNVLREISKIAEFYGNYCEFVMFVGLNGMREEDWNYSEYNGKPVQPVVGRIAQGLSKWIKSHPEAGDNYLQFAIDWNMKALDCAYEDDAKWIRIGLLPMLERAGMNEEAEQVRALIPPMQGRNQGYSGSSGSNSYGAPSANPYAGMQGGMMPPNDYGI